MSIDAAEVIIDASVVPRQHTKVHECHSYIHRAEMDYFHRTWKVLHKGSVVKCVCGQHWVLRRRLPFIREAALSWGVPNCYWRKCSNPEIDPIK